MTRQNKLHEIASMHLEAYAFKLIIPVPHAFYKHDASIFERIDVSKWVIGNGDQKTCRNTYETYNIKHYIHKNMLPAFDAENRDAFLAEEKSLLLERPIHRKIIIDNGQADEKNRDEETITLEKITLWIFPEKIAFFTIHLDIDHTRYTVDQLIEMQNRLRQFKLLKVSQESDAIRLSPQPVGSGERDDVLDHLLGLATVDTRQILNIEKERITEPIIDGTRNDLYPIYNATASAKTISAMQLDREQFSDSTDIEPFETGRLDRNNANDISILNEFNYYLGSHTKLSAPKAFMPDDGYIYEKTTEHGFGVWKYSSGLILHDSCSFVGIRNQGGYIAEDAENVTYFIYMLNLYIILQLKYIEEKLIDPYFLSPDVAKLYKKLQKLKNQFISEEIAKKFQENEINRAMQKALSTKEIVQEITDNLTATKEITKNNYGIIIAIFSYIAIEHIDFIKSHLPLVGTVAVLAVCFTLCVARKRIARRMVTFGAYVRSLG